MAIKGIILLSTGGLLGFILGFNVEFLIIGLIFILIDIITGIICSYKNKLFSREKLKDGVLKKILECIVLIGFILIQYIIILSGVTFPIIGAIFFAFYFKEFGSTLENVDKTYPNTIPKPVLKWFLITEKTIYSLLERKN